MTINEAISSIQAALTEATIQSTVSLDLAIALHQASDGSIKAECIHSRSSRVEQVHRLKLELSPPAIQESNQDKQVDLNTHAEPIPQPPSLPEHIKQQIDAAEPSVKTLKYLKENDPNYLKAVKKSDLRLW